VWKEWTEPERFADWFGGGEAEVPLSTVLMDVREGAPGGRRCSPAPAAARSKGEYREVVAPKRLVFTVSDRPGEDGYELVVVVRSDLGDGRTEMLVQQHGRMSAKQYERAGQGWSSFFDRMTGHLADT
jgi:uncharacterized protein YndB with AHSA1/START domain